jgi:hypothetical protein
MSSTETLHHFIDGERVQSGPHQHDVSPSGSSDIVVQRGAADASVVEGAVDAGRGAAAGWSDTVLAREEGKTRPRLPPRCVVPVRSSRCRRVGRSATRAR